LKQNLRLSGNWGTKYYEYSGDGMKQFSLNAKMEMENQQKEKILGSLHDQQGDLLTVAVVFGGGSYILMRTEDTVECSICNEKEVYAFQGTIVSRDSGEFITYTVKVTSEVKVLQRRGHVRVPCSDALHYSGDPAHLPLALERKDPKTMNLRSFKNGRMLDLSGSGMKLEVKERLEQGKELVLLLDLGNQQMLIKGKVVSSYVELHKEKRHYCYGIAFVDLPERKQDRIIQFIFNLMRKVKPL
jgi:c-di-GMP-binding flagellar brake protein YcgR